MSLYQACLMHWASVAASFYSKLIGTNSTFMYFLLLYAIFFLIYMIYLNDKPFHVLDWLIMLDLRLEQIKVHLSVNKSVILFVQQDVIKKAMKFERFKITPCHIIVTII